MLDDVKLAVEGRVPVHFLRPLRRYDTRTGRTHRKSPGHFVGRCTMSVIFSKTAGLTETATHYCPGCTHGIAHRLVAEALEELGLLGDTIGCASVGCSILSYNYFNVDMIECSHGRAPAVATGIKRTVPDKTVFTYQGDGDLASIGTAEIVHAAHRGENITVIFVNNAIYGMTGGQMAPTTLTGQKTTTAPEGEKT